MMFASFSVLFAIVKTLSSFMLVYLVALLQLRALLKLVKLKFFSLDYDVQYSYIIVHNEQLFLVSG